jgi:hypothetical protein
MDLQCFPVQDDGLINILGITPLLKPCFDCIGQIVEGAAPVRMGCSTDLQCFSVQGDGLVNILGITLLKPCLDCNT